ncbi:putative ABC transporter ATP-binding protein YhcH [Paenibacillus sp. J31TS4]|uniref:ABC transporter ATP-binding protein n=1 Tax=Paenibacillus sp. J31TS4 TaxID=2807195 RepID=UPI001B0A20D5|nr:ABC transporter ATP-binding protein [Paenibacillus sp. J31TS4]GIP38066.1 putative ABC transporter ATP-binding protein YhcH [Paenibacillus sp. J31TS4]
MTRETVVQIRGLTKRIKGKTIVDSLTFDVPGGEVFGFLGPNGAGKTTTIRMMVGLMGMSGGEVLIDGISVKKDFTRAISRVGAIVENPEMYKFLTGYQNLIHFARMHPGIPKSRIDEVVELVGLGQRIHEKVKTYSLGMRQRLGVAQAMLHKPAVLILDEPTNGLDPAGIRELRDYLRTLAAKEGTAVIVSSHLLSEMELMCDRVAILQKGKLVTVKSLKEWMGRDAAPRHVFEVDRPADAAAVLQRTMGLAPAAIGHQQLEVEAERERIPGMTAQLIAAGIAVFGIRKVQSTLEEQFLAMTGGDQVG